MCHLLLLSVWLLVACPAVKGHGRLVDPPSRNSMWRFGFHNPVNYNDNELNCGGFSHQWTVHHGKCGVCGDPYGKWQAHVFPGTYANGIIAKTYRKGQVIDVNVQITANHKGYFVFKVGDKGTGAITEEKLVNVLKLARSRGKRYYLPKNSGARSFVVSLQLPPMLLCENCVLQWTYVAGNSWGSDKSGKGIGKGAQETFVNCADISIQEDTGPQPTVLASSPSLPATGTEPISERFTRRTKVPPKRETTPLPPISWPEQTAMQHATKRRTEGPTTTGSGNCHGAGFYAKVPGMDAWCNANCPEFCPKSHCSCSAEPTRAPVQCYGAGAYASVPGMDSWCNSNCPAFCPATHCICSQ